MKPRELDSNGEGDLSLPPICARTTETTGPLSTTLEPDNLQAFTPHRGPDCVLYACRSPGLLKFRSHRLQFILVGSDSIIRDIHHTFQDVGRSPPRPLRPLARNSPEQKRPRSSRQYLVLYN